MLAAGGVETPRLLLHTGLANSSDQVGRNFTAHGATQVWARFDESMRSYRGYPSSIITEDFVRPSDADFAGGYLIQSLGVQPLTFATSLVRGGGLRGAALVKAMRDYPQMAGVGINAECLPYEDNRLVLGEEVDEHGIRKATITFTPGENEDAIGRHAVRTMTAIIEAAGGRTSGSSNGPRTPSAPHGWARTPTVRSSMRPDDRGTSRTCGSVTTRSSRAPSSRTRR